MKTTHRRVADFHTEAGHLQIVEILNGLCTVGYKPSATGRWLYWGIGEGGYEATVRRFTDSQTYGTHEETCPT